jgi:hypothetical protein
MLLVKAGVEGEGRRRRRRRRFVDVVDGGGIGWWKGKGDDRTGASSNQTDRQTGQVRGEWRESGGPGGEVTGEGDYLSKVTSLWEFRSVQKLPMA